MKWLPVIGRELRSEARQPFTYWMRVVAAAIALSIAVLGSFDRWQGSRGGSAIFDIVQPTLFSLIWLFAPIMTCDSISRERREGTLGLLLLTLLRPMDVGLAKACSGIVRSLSVVLAVLPILSIALLLGGVSRTELLRAGMMDAMALLAAIAAGLLASSRCRNFSRAAVLALVYAALALLILGNIQTAYFILDRTARPNDFIVEDFLIILVVGPWVLCAGITEVWRLGGSLPAAGYLWLSGVQVLLAALFLVGVLVYLDRNLRRLAFETGRSARQEWWWRLLCTPRLFREWLKRSQRWLLNRNPIGWLQCRTWSARLCTWGWLGVVVLVETALLSVKNGGDLSHIRDGQLVMGCFVAVGLAFSAADSFRAERETGALELLLVTPLTVRQIIAGRIFGVWGQYLLAFALLIGMWCVASNWLAFPPWRWYSGIGGELGKVWFLTALLFLSTFFLVPVIGLSQSMVRKHFVTSWIVTLTLGVVIPVFLPGSVLYGILFVWFRSLQGWEGYWSITALVAVAILLQTIFASAAALRLYRNLNQRLFATDAKG